MNAPDKNAALAHYGAMVDALESAEVKAEKRIYDAQPKVGEAFGDRQLLKSEYDEDGLLIDFYGSFDRWGGYEVSDVSLSGSDISILAVIPIKKIQSYSDWCNRKLPSYLDQQQAASYDY